jgi:thiosulfate/3-mercaptopyruvate sulfurtransferase
MKFLPLAAVCVLFAWPVSLFGAEAEYARPELLIEPAELARPEVADNYVVLDARSRAAYEKSHLPNAHWVDHDAWAKDFGDGTDAKGWSERIGRLGIGSESKVVVYDDVSMKNAARIWWILRYWGVENARLLNGGWNAWASQLRPTSSGPVAAAPVRFEAQAYSKRLATKSRVLEDLKSAKVQIVDARSEGEFCGTQPGSNKRAGALPGARHLEWSELVDPETHRFKSADEINALLKKAGIDPQKPVVAHCQSGGRASVMVFGLELMGAKDVANYYKGWSEWGNADDTPVEAGKK